MAPDLITIPSNDAAFRRFVHRTLGHIQAASPEAFEQRLRVTYPRALVRERGLVGELASWYVYRDGAWRAPDGDTWWEDPAVPRVEASVDGWIEGANPTARGLLGLADDLAAEPRHFTDFVIPGALEDAVALYEIVRDVGSLEATVVLLPTSGDAMAVDLRVAATDDGITAAFRLAHDLDVPASVPRADSPERIEYLPRTDVAFRAYAQRALSRMPEPTLDGLALRLRRLYPHAQVEATPDGWVARRDHGADGRPDEAWWQAAGLPRVRYDARALILEANDAAASFFGRQLAGRHWQELVTAGSTEEVGVMLDILAEAGAAESRFRMPRGDGTLLEFDSYTVAEGDEFTTVFRPA
ncbi:MAG TPA: hypothetical protein VFW20_06285 [Candidatus Limnocylindrales bacterium]|nr:hypothetical protein [Candidatus Limnocylindrales bacterium]